MSSWRVALAVGDALSVAVAMLLATTLHFTGAVPAGAWGALHTGITLAAAMLVITNHCFGLYNRVWRYAGAETAVAVAASVSITFIAAGLTARMLAPPLPAMIWYAAGMAVMAWVGGVRLTWRLIRPAISRVRLHANGSAKRILVYGSGRNGCALPRTLETLSGAGYRVVGFVDDDPGRVGVMIGAAKVLGTGADLARVVRKCGADEVIIALATVERSKLREIYVACREAGVRATRLPPLLEIIESPRVATRDVHVGDLLRRDIGEGGIELHDNYIEGRTVLVTGAGGSIGSELCRQICRYGPKRLVLLGRGENRIHWIYLHLKQAYPNVELVPRIANVTVVPTMRQVFEEHRPDIVFHAAAHKHVYLMEPVPAEAARNNILGTGLLADLAVEYGTSRFVFISSDKAVAPRSIMGCTKRVGEILLTAREPSATDFISVRFGNVLGSEGSVLEIFRRQLQRGEPLTVTHAEATRFFMSIPEACFLVLQAGAIGTHGDLFVLDMGDPIRIVDLARDFIMLSGGNPDAPDAIRITGLVPGEKLHECLSYPQEAVERTEDRHILRIKNGRLPWTSEDVRQRLERIRALVDAADHQGVRAAMLELVGRECE